MRRNTLKALLLLPLLFPFALFCADSGTPAAPDTEKAADNKADKDKEKEEKEKEAPFKVSAWCAFRDLSYIAPNSNKKPDPKSEESRPGSLNWTGFGRRGQWCSVVVEVKNTTEKTQYKGSIATNLNPLRVNDKGQVLYSTRYRQEFEVGPQTTKLLHFSVLCPEESWGSEALTVQITANGFLYTRSVQIHDLEGQDFVVVVSESSGGFRGLMTPRSNQPNYDPMERQRHVAVVEPADLPSRWHDLTAANLIILDGPPREPLTDAQWDALNSYVKSGGHLLITAGKDPSRLNKQIQELAGIQPVGMQEIESIDTIEPKLIPVRKDWRLPLVQVKAAMDGSADVRLNRKSGYVEFIRRSYGSGSVTFVPFTFSDPALLAWEGRQIVPKEIVQNSHQRTLFTIQDSDTAPPKTGYNYPYYGYQKPVQNDPASISELRYKLDESFSKDTPVQMQSKPTVLSFLLFYLLCAVPGNYLLFGWFKRREVAWLAVPLWAASFSVIAYVVGYMGQTGKLTVNEVSVIEAGPGQTLGVARTFLGLYAPHRDEYRIEFPADKQAAPGHLINYTMGENKNLDLPELNLVDNDSGISVERLLVQQRSTRELEIVHRAQLGEGVELSMVQNAGGSFDIKVVNKTGANLFNPVLIYQQRAILLGTEQEKTLLPKGESQQLSNVGFNLDPENAFFGKTVVTHKVRGVHAKNRTDAVQEYLKSHIGNFQGGVFCAWMDGGFLPVKIGSGGNAAESPGQFEGLTLLLTPVPTKWANLETAGNLRVRYCTDYDPKTGQGSWVPYTGNDPNEPIQFAENANGNNNGQSNAEVFIELRLVQSSTSEDDSSPQRAHLSFKLGIGPTYQATNLQYNGQAELGVLSAGKTAANIINNQYITIRSNSSWDMKGHSYSISENTPLILKVSLKNLRYSYLNQGGTNPWIGNPCPIEIQNIQFYMVKKPSVPKAE